MIYLEDYKPPKGINYIEDPVIEILGERGDGKTLLMTGLGYAFKKYDNFNVWANYNITGYKNRYYNFEELSQFPEDLINAVVLMDEAHVGVDAYNSLMGSVKNITKFVTQLRKRNVILIYSTQRHNTVAKRLRNMVNYTIEVNKVMDMGEFTGYINCFVFNREKPLNEDFVKQFTFNGNPFFEMYDTGEIISG